jgi:hypothetical protein
MMEEITNKLLEQGYPANLAISVSKQLNDICLELKPMLSDWLTRNAQPIASANGYTTDSLMKRFDGMTYPAALLTIDWLMREPEKASEIIEKGIR